MLATIDNPESDGALVTEIAELFTSSFGPLYDKEFAAKVIDRVASTRGVIALLPVLASLDSDSQQELKQEIIVDAVAAFRIEADEKRRGEIARGLIRVIDDLDPELKQAVITCYAENYADEFPYDLRLRPNEEKSDQENEFLRQSVLKAIEALEPSQAIGRADAFKEWFDEGDVTLKQALYAKFEALDSISSSQVDALKSLLSEEELQTVFAGIFGRVNDTYDLQSTFSTAAGVFGLEKAKAMFATQIRTIPDLAFRLIAKNQMMLEDEELKELIKVVVDADQIQRLMHEIDHLAYRLPKDELINLLDVAVNKAPRPLLKELKALTGFIDEATTNRLIQAVMQQNPAIVLSSFKILPKGFIDGADEVVEFMKGDERTTLAPKYFQKIMKNLPKAEDTTAFLIMSKEAEHVYMKLNKILSVDENKGKEMLLRIKETMGKTSERAELESISLASLVAVEGVDPTAIETVDDAKKCAATFINERLNSHLDPESFAELEEKIGSVVPLSMYAMSISRIGENATGHYGYLNELISQLDQGNYQSWRYGERTALINEAILPNITQEQYEMWQESKSTATSDIVANDSASVARRIQEVVSRGLIENNTVAALSNLTDSTAVLGDIKTEIGTIGKRISEIHEMKKAGAIDNGDAQARVAEFQDQMKQLELATNIVRLSRVTPEEVAEGSLFNEKGRPTKATIDGVLSDIVEQYGTEALEAFEQLATMLENYRAAATTDIGRITTSDVDDFQTTFEIGANPVGSCQHYELGQLNMGLLGYFEPSAKIITVRNQNDKFVARAVCRLAWGENDQAVMVVEPVYMSQASNDIEGAIIAHAKSKAHEMGLQLFIEGNGGRNDIRLRNQRAPQLYSDVFGGLREKGSEKPATARNGFVLVGE